MFIIWYILTRNYHALECALQRYFFRLGGIYCKVAQLLAPHGALLGEPLSKILKKQRHSYVKPRLWEQEHIQKYLDKLDNPKFLCSGSFAYIYTGDYQNKTVVLKVLRPNVKEHVAKACKYLRIVFSIVDYFCPKLIAVEQWETIEELIWNSCDLRKEVQNANIYKELHAKKGRLYTPIIYDYSSKWIIMEYISGRALSEIEDNKELVKATTRRLLKTFTYGIFPTDINPSNIIITPHNKVVLIDFGMLSVFSEDTANKTGIFLAYISLKLLDNAYRYFKKHLCILPDNFDNDKASPAFKNIMNVEIVYDKTLSMYRVLSQLSAWSYTHDVILKKEFTESWLFLLNLQVTMQELNPEVIFLIEGLKGNALSHVTKNTTVDLIKNLKPKLPRYTIDIGYR